MIYTFGITGPIEHGKSLFARHLRASMGMADFEAQVIPIFERAKELARSEFGWNGKKDERGRALLQAIGFTAGRTYNPNIWIDRWVHHINVNLDVVVQIADDVRFQNEGHAIRNLGGKIIHITREGKGIESTHPAEGNITSEPGDIHMAFPYTGEVAMIEATAKFVAMCQRGFYDA